MTTQFPKMGEEPLTNSLVNVSGDRSPNTTPVARKGPSSDQDPSVGTKANRGVGSLASGEHSGPSFRPQTTISFPNSPEASDTGRGMRTIRSVASKTGNGDFWSDRAESQSGQVI